MLFNSYAFLIFFPIVCMVAFILPAKARRFWLLCASYYFYMSWNAKYALLMLFSTLVTYLSGLLIDRFRTSATDATKHRQKLVVFGCFALNLGILFFFKYFDFMLGNVNRLLTLAHSNPIHTHFDVLLPVGISFYTFQALSYTMDVYRNDIPAEHNFVRYALFVSFFPQLVAGPIERSGNLLRQIDQAGQICKWNSCRVIQGLEIMVIGFFLKMVVADRLAIFVDIVFGHYYEFSSLALLGGAIGFAFQIYCDFNGYTLIAIGAAKVLGFDLMENFDAPYLSRSIAKFWKRWHISLTSWFRDYLYIPLGGNRCGKRRVALNIMVVFLLSGLWHGASWNFVVWGGLNGLFQLMGMWLKPQREKWIQRLGIRTQAFSYKAFQVIGTFCLVDITWVFFRSISLKSALEYLWLMLTRWDPWNLLNGSLYHYGLSGNQMAIAAIGLVFVIGMDLVKRFQHRSLAQLLDRQNLWLRLPVYLVLILLILTWGIYGPAYNAMNFIYFQF